MTQSTYPEAGYQPPAPQPVKKGIGIAAMVLGIIALVFGFIPVIAVLSFILGPLAVILGVIGFIKRRGRGQAITGVITGAIGFVVAIIGFALAGAFLAAVDEEMQSAEEVEERIEEAAEEAGEDDADVEEIEAAVEEEDEPAGDPTGEWVEVATLSGSGDQRGEVFTISGDARIVYEFNATDEDFGIASVYMMAEGDTLAEQGGLPELMPSGSESGDTMFYQTGNFYLDVNAANYDSWTVTIEEQQ